jgi:hypothetical protein
MTPLVGRLIWVSITSTFRLDGPSSLIEPRKISISGSNSVSIHIITVTCNLYLNVIMICIFYIKFRASLPSESIDTSDLKTESIAFLVRGVKYIREKVLTAEHAIARCRA